MPALCAAIGSFHVKSPKTYFVIVLVIVRVLPFFLTVSLIRSVTLFVSILGNPVSASFDNRLTRFGWALGVGLEAHLIGNWTGKLEYLHMDFGSIPTVVPNGTVSTQFNSRITDDVVRVGVNYKFDRIGAVVANTDVP
jgi:opacity protein-like surface antigen